MRTLIMLIFSCLALSGIAAAQRADTLRAEEIVQRAIARRAEVRSTTTSFTATLHSRSLVEIRASNFIATALLPTQQIADESIGTYYRDQRGKSHIRVTANGTRCRTRRIKKNVINGFCRTPFRGISRDHLHLPRETQTLHIFFQTAKTPGRTIQRDNVRTSSSQLRGFTARGRT